MRGRPGTILTCKDFADLGIECCEACHDVENLDPLLRIRVDGQEALVCCEIMAFFYPDEADQADFWQAQMDEAEALNPPKPEDFENPE
jgi:hypothetical protein